jgi:hypothetical protein
MATSRESEKKYRQYSCIITTIICHMFIMIFIEMALKEIASIDIEWTEHEQELIYLHIEFKETD